MTQNCLASVSQVLVLPHPPAQSSLMLVKGGFFPTFYNAKQGSC